MFQNYECILVGIDGSRQAFEAFKVACAIAKRNQAFLLAVHVIDQNLPRMIGFSPINASLYDREEKLAESYLSTCREYAYENHFAPLKTLVVQGSARSVLVDELPQKYRVDLIVVGQSGLHALERVMIGSVADYVIHQASCDCLIVPYKC